MRILRFFKKSPPPAKTSSDFSVFFRKATLEEKEAVFMNAARKASADQRQVIEEARKATVTPA